MLQRCGKAAADHITEHIEDHHIGVFQQVMLLEQLDRLTDHVAATAGAGGRAAGLDAHDAVVALEHEVLDPQLFGVEVDRLEHVDDRRQHLLGQREGGVVLGVAADLQHPLAQLGKRGGQVARRRALADAALAVDRKAFGRADADAGVHLHLDTAGAVGRATGADLAHRNLVELGHAAAFSTTPSRRSSSSSPARRSAASVSASGCQ
mmetsp:Transcript_71777/g.198876  ORF Transcript_71777/g.198876 Transcript_71777/m.198876 type:complete len:207 (+) Transcript_71777:1000-1620(+)